MDNEIEKIAKKYKLDKESSERVNHRSMDVISFKSTDKVKFLEMENEKISKKYLEALEKIKILSKALENPKSIETGTMEILNQNEELEICKENLIFFQGQTKFLINEAQNSEAVFAEEIQILQRKLELCSNFSDFEKISMMKELIFKQELEIKTLKRNSEISEEMIEKLKGEIVKVQQGSEEEIENLQRKLAELQKNYEEIVKKHSKLIEENTYFKAKNTNAEYEIESLKSKLHRIGAFPKFLN